MAETMLRFLILTRLIVIISYLKSLDFVRKHKYINATLHIFFILIFDGIIENQKPMTNNNTDRPLN